MIFLSPLKSLTLLNASQKDRLAHLSAASGLVQVGDCLYVIADDENHIGIFNRNNQSGILKRLFPGNLPLTLEERKAEKPDLEVLILVPSVKKYPYGALLALGSGSKKNRTLGVIIAFNERGDLDDDVEVINLTSLYQEIKKQIGKLNIEGGVIIADDIILFQRGNKKNKVNATISCPVKQFFQYASPSAARAEIGDLQLDLKVAHYELGEIADVPFCFTDAAHLPNGAIVFAAAAENTSDAYLDGACMGSVIGIITPQGELQSVSPIDKIIKVEGIAAKVIGDKVHLLLVTDADDETSPAQLYSAELIGYPFNLNELASIKADI